MNRRRFSLNIFLLFVLLISSNTTLPQVQFCFTATVVNDNDVLIEWTWGIREMNDYGFYVQRRVQGEPEFEDLPNSFVPMHELPDYSWIDEGVPPGDYDYRLRKVDLDGTAIYSCEIAISIGSSVTSVTTSVLPKNFSLEQNYPNPFNPRTNFQFSISNFQFVSLRIFDVLGREVAVLVNEVKQPGTYSVTWDASNMPSGVSSKGGYASAYISIGCRQGISRIRKS